MLTVLQRVRRAEVHVEDQIIGTIGRGALLLVCVEADDLEADADATADKIANLRFFPGEQGMDRSIKEVGGACLVVSQFTLAGDVRKGRRPSFTRAAPPKIARALYERLAAQLESVGIDVTTGQFAANMTIDMSADGPVTLLIATKDGRVL